VAKLPEQLDRGRIAPVHIIKHQHSWPFGKEYPQPHVHDLEQFELKRIAVNPGLLFSLSSPNKASKSCMARKRLSSRSYPLTTQFLPNCLGWIIVSDSADRRISR
jgi:hypothetical protein